MFQSDLRFLARQSSNPQAGGCSEQLMAYGVCFRCMALVCGRARLLDEARQMQLGETGAFGRWCRLSLLTSADLKQGQTYSITTTAVHDTKG